MQTVASLADNVKRERRMEGWTQDELARRSGVGLATVSRIEQGEIEHPRVSTLRKIAAALDLEIRDLYEE